MNAPGEREGMAREVARGVGLLGIVVGMLTVGTLGPEAFTLEAAAAAVETIVTASRSASPAPLVAAGLFFVGVLLAVRVEYGPFGAIDATQRRRSGTCRICEHRIGESRTECPYCNTADPVDSDAAESR
ncbi:hypothetical protein [Halorussus pelagicus]|uniref:hypothetical protein n=1 Tax=Halorussus pelagicus TaxID=2505977 RepID=UPI000FFB0E39|nr:hypothetical protein [Halorussus pelagicus]